MFYLILYFIILTIGVFCFRNDRIMNIGVSETHQTKRLEVRLFLFLCWFLLSFIAAMRGDEVGIDTQSYIAIYERFSKGLSVNEVSSFATTIEHGYLVFSRIIISIFKSRFFFFFINSGIIYGCYLFFIKKNSNDLIISTLLFISLYYTSTFNVMRQYLSIGIILVSIEAIKEKKYFPTLILIALAIIIHHSSIMLILGVLLYLLPNKSKNIILYESLIICFLCVIRIPRIFEYLIQLLNYNRLLNGVHFKASDSNGIMALVYLLVVILGIVVCLRNSSNDTEEDEIFAYYLINTSIGTGFAFLAGNNEMFARAGAGYISFIIILFPFLVTRIFKDQKSLCLAKVLIIAFLCFAMYINGRSYQYYSYI